MDYSLDETLDSGQAFRWQRGPTGWEGVVARRWLRLWRRVDSFMAETAEPQTDWRWLIDYLQLEDDLPVILADFPDDPPLRAAIQAARGLRLLRQEPWECLASFILSATKQIVQIRQIVELLCARFGDPIPALTGDGVVRAFPTPERLAACSEAELRACKAGFRAPRLLAAARAVAGGGLDLETLAALPLAEARARLMALDGVGRKIADCVLLFAGGFREVFPIDVWVLRALHELYFPTQRPKPAELRRFSETHFGPQAGYAQQYLFHYLRVHQRRRPSDRTATLPSEGNAGPRRQRSPREPSEGVSPASVGSAPSADSED
ncbi:MAG: DNA-3-methyladenine glycosylase 2 family protein [Verrucomicrobiales bacterium]|nr:DNA-3-methyladenine glycosylase 2 family protein [Verrucomicrobiales bacterium]MCP5527032.1 DNA-3-methyladenine glycosylase 2 family protein [Verrucomicrobiales bacterium]